MKKRITRMLAMLLCVLSIVALLPTTALAADGVDKVELKTSAIANSLKAAGAAKATANSTRKYTVKKGSCVTFSVSNTWYYGSTRVAVKYQWYVKKTSGGWKKIKGATKYKYSFKAKKKMNGYKYRCKITMKSDSRVYVYSDTIKLKVK